MRRDVFVDGPTSEAFVVPLNLGACGLTRVLVPAFLIGLGVATFAGNDLYGWIAAAVAGVGILAVRKLRGTSRTCPLPAPNALDGADDGDAVPTR